MLDVKNLFLMSGFLVGLSIMHAFGAPIDAAQSAPPAGVQSARTHALGVQKQQSQDEGQKTLIADAVSAIHETQRATDALSHSDSKTALAALERATGTSAQDMDTTFCTFRPQSDACQPLYQHSLKDPDPAAVSVKEAFESYGRYVRAAKGPLTDDDRSYLSANNIALPPDLNNEDLAGLHALLNDETQHGDTPTRVRAINGFLSRAVQAELYCYFNACETLRASRSLVDERGV